MRHTTFTNTALRVVLLAFGTVQVDARHLHRGLVHRHVQRADTVSLNATFPSYSPLPSATSAGAIEEDVQTVQQGLTTLSDDILRFVSSLEQRLQELEGLLASLLSSSASTTDTPPAPAAAADNMIYSSSTLATTAAIISSMTMLSNAQGPPWRGPPRGPASGAATSSNAPGGPWQESSMWPSPRPTNFNGAQGPPWQGPSWASSDSTTTITSTTFIVVTSYTSITLNAPSSSAAPTTLTTMPSANTLSSTGSSTMPSAETLATAASSSPSPSVYTSAASSPTPQSTSVTEVYNSAVTTYVTTDSSSVVQTIASVTQIQTVQPTASAYTFNPQARDNVAVYYGAGPVAPIGGLLGLCENPNVDMVMLAFLNEFFGPDGSPSLAIEGGCSPANTAQSGATPGLIDCTELATEIAGCQQIGKPVLLSLGGYLANTTFTSDDQAQNFTETLWNLFGAGNQTQGLRPFGNVTIDGFDIDTEQKTPQHYEYFTTSLRKQFTLDPNNKTYYISAAPQCPRPDASIPIGAMLQADFIFVQFYNNPTCNLNSTGFAASFAAWTQDLSANSTNSSSTSTRPAPRLYIGAAAFSGAGSGYVAGADLREITKPATNLYVANQGGMMLWDGPSAMANVDAGGGSYLEYAKRAMQ